MNFLNKSSLAIGVGVGVGTGARIKAGTRSGPEIRLQDGAEEVLPE